MAGAWACAAAKLVAGNLAKQELEDQFAPLLRMWVRQEQLDDGRQLTDVFNETRENPKCGFIHDPRFRCVSGVRRRDSMPLRLSSAMAQHVARASHATNGAMSCKLTVHNPCRYLPGVHIGDNVTAYPDLKV